MDLIQEAHHELIHPRNSFIYNCITLQLPIYDAGIGILLPTDAIKHN